MKFITILFFTFFVPILCTADILPKDSILKVDPMDFFVIFSLSKILWTLFFFVVVYIFITLFTKLLGFFAEKSAKVRIAIKGFIPIFRITLWTLFIVVIIKVIYSPPKEMLLTALASVAIAVGFATQDLLKNIFGGI
ncbi:MAG: mechanosensitive ion channel, partial [Sulfurimonas sp.]|nr:mechanosensitive ion channel [Sulfurimonas sp.]